MTNVWYGLVSLFLFGLQRSIIGSVFQIFYLLAQELSWDLAVILPLPSQVKAQSLAWGLYYQYRTPQPQRPILFEPGAFKPGQGLPRQLGTSNLVSRTLAKLKSLGFQMLDVRFCISDFVFQILVVRFWMSDFEFQILDFRF